MELKLHQRIGPASERSVRLSRGSGTRICGRDEALSCGELHPLQITAQIGLQDQFQDVFSLQI
jgi:hypothetical protein